MLLPRQIAIQSIVHRTLSEFDHVNKLPFILEVSCVPQDSEAVTLVTFREKLRLHCNFGGTISNKTLLARQKSSLSEMIDDHAASNECIFRSINLSKDKEWLG